MGEATCRHCKKEFALSSLRRRGLCRRCYTNIDIRRLYGAIARNKNPIQPWTEAEFETLRTLTKQRLSDMEIARIMGRSRLSVYAKRQYIGLSKRDATMIVVSGIPPGRSACRHCQAKLVNRPLGLCWQCYYTSGVREMYPSGSKFTRKGEGNGFKSPQLDPVPSSELPGTPEKVAVLEERARNGYALWHPLDAVR